MGSLNDTLKSAPHEEHQNILRQSLLKFASEKLIGEILVFIETQNQYHKQMTGPNGPWHTHEGAIPKMMYGHISDGIQNGLSAKIYAVRDALANELRIDDHGSFNFSSGGESPDLLVSKLKDAAGRIADLGGQLEVPVFS